MYVFEGKRGRERERAVTEGEGQSEKQTSSQAGSPMWCLIPGPWGHDLSQKQTLN